ncbi:MAG: hypothetical protein AAGA56_05715 [Myxococcota bacterium]
MFLCLLGCGDDGDDRNDDDEDVDRTSVAASDDESTDGAANVCQLAEGKLRTCLGDSVESADDIVCAGPTACASRCVMAASCDEIVDSAGGADNAFTQCGVDCKDE